MYIYIYICVCVCVCVCMYICLPIYQSNLFIHLYVCPEFGIDLSFCFRLIFENFIF